jgi:hypothetical protein
VKAKGKKGAGKEVQPPIAPRRSILDYEDEEEGLKPGLRPISQEVIDDLLVCGLCGFIHERRKWFIRHIISHHLISYKVYVVRVRYAGVWPECSCGCGRRADVGLSVFKRDTVLLAKDCERRIAKERSRESRALRGKLLRLVGQVRRHPLRKKSSDARINAENELEVLDALNVAGSVDRVAYDYRTWRLERRLHELKDRRTRDEKNRVDYVERSRRRSKKSVDSPTDEEIAEKMPTRLRLGFDTDEEMWDAIERETKR